MLAKKFDKFGWDRDRGTLSHDRMMTDWMTALQDYALDEVQAACRQAVLDFPNKQPNEGHIRKLIMKHRGTYNRLNPGNTPIGYQHQTKQVTEKKINPERKMQADKIIRDVGYRKKVT